MCVEGLNQILPAVLRDLGERKPTGYAAITKSWESVVGTDHAAHSEPYALRGKILFVRVDDSTRAFELSRRYKRSIIRRIQHEVEEDYLHDIVFRVGTLSRSHLTKNLTQDR